MKTYPFSYARYEDVEKVMTQLTSYDRDKWASAFSEVAKPYEERAVQAEEMGNIHIAKENYLLAYQYYRLARSLQLIQTEKNRRTESHRKCC